VFGFGFPAFFDSHFCGFMIRFLRGFELGGSDVTASG
jgi:hypothetical protein